MSTLDDDRKRYPNLGKLSIAILEHYIKPILGENAIKEIKSPVVRKELEETLIKVLQRTEQRFTKEHTDQEFCDAVLNLPGADLPSIVEAVKEFHNNPNKPVLYEVLIEQLHNTFPKASSTRVEQAAKMYVKILREELAIITSPTFSEKLKTLSTINIEEYLRQILNLLIEILRSPEMRGIPATVKEGKININPINRMGHNIFHAVIGELRFFVNTHFYIKSSTDAEILTLSLDYGSESLGIDQHVVVDEEVYETKDYIILVKPITLLPNKTKRIALSRSFKPPLDFEEQDIGFLDYGVVLISFDAQFANMEGIFHEEVSFKLAPGGKLLPMP